MTLSAPDLVYGTAWKEDRTEGLVREALDAGFLGIDTANQRKHYYEEGVGRALAGKDRSKLWLQTKFTYQRGQDHRLPYDPKAAISDQVHQSMASSLDHLGTDYVDSYVLHGPWGRFGLTSQDREAWGAMEELHAAGKARALGISNVDAGQLELLCREATVKPTFVQNRCYAALGWDSRVREVCRQHGVRYQGFSLLTANVPVVRSQAVAQLAQRYGKTPAQIVLRLALDLGMVALTGTTQRLHMDQDLAIGDFSLQPDEVSLLEGIAQ